jgi:putative membrane protein
MKTLKIALIAAVAAFALQACHSTKDSKASADSANKTNDTTNKTLPDTAKAMAMTVDKDDAAFAVEAANGGMSEVNLGKLAQDKGTGQKVKDFAGQMVKDHSKANDELMTLAKSKNITLPAVVSDAEQKHFDDLNKKAGSDFDGAYVKMMVDDHKTDVKAFEDATTKLKDPDLKAFAIKTLPTLKMHLNMIVKIDSTMKMKK